MTSTILFPNTAAAPAEVKAVKPDLFAGCKVELQAVTKDSVKPVQKDPIRDEMIKLLDEVLHSAIKVNMNTEKFSYEPVRSENGEVLYRQLPAKQTSGEVMPAWVGAHVKSKGYLIYLQVPGPKRVKWDTKNNQPMKNERGETIYRRLPGIRIPLMNAKDFIALKKENHDESMLMMKRMFAVAPYIKALLEVVLNQSQNLRDEVQNRLGIAK